MQTINLLIFIACCGFSELTFRQLAFKNHVALAFGVPVPSADGVYLPLDAVAMRLMGELSLVIGRDAATAIILTHFDIWADAVGRAEVEGADDVERYMYLCVAVADAGFGKDGEFIITSGTRDELYKDFEGVPITKAVTASITGIIKDIRARAGAKGVELDQMFFWPPDHPEFAKLVAEAKHERMMALRRHRGGKKYKHHLKRKPVGRSLKPGTTVQ